MRVISIFLSDSQQKRWCQTIPLKRYPLSLICCCVSWALWSLWLFCAYFKSFNLESHKHSATKTSAMIYQLLPSFGLCVCGSRMLTACTITPLYNRTTCPPAAPVCCRCLVGPTELWMPVCKTQSKNRKHCWLTQHYPRDWNRVLTPELGKHWLVHYCSHETQIYSNTKTCIIHSINERKMEEENVWTGI